MADSTIFPAVRAYEDASARLRNMSVGDVPSLDNVGKSTGTDFSNMVGNVVARSVNSAAENEAVAAKALNGQASLDELAVAVTNAELTLRTVVSVRDRVISAYQDIIKMPI
jgi:flagellar hook-basal body complex protein FliE